jgi:hypothetical protein
VAACANAPARRSRTTWHTVPEPDRSLTTRRAYELFRNGDKQIYGDSPIRELFEHGQGILLRTYVRITESHVWALVDRWREHQDVVLADLSGRVLDRRLLKTVDVDPTHHREVRELQDKAEEIVKKQLNLTDDCVSYYVQLDEASPVSYRQLQTLRLARGTT